MSFITSPGVVGFSNLQNTAVPNNLVPVSYFLASGGSYANIDSAIGPKGTGALLAQIPNNLASGGNKRGTNAVDLQTVRAANTQVASGVDAVLCGGTSNTTDGQFAAVVGGNQNSALGQISFVGGGQNNSVSAIGTGGAIAGGLGNAITNGYAFIGGGDTNSATAQRASVIGGGNNVADGAFSTVWGQYATSRGIYGAVAYAANRIGTTGDNQEAIYQGLALTTNAAATVLTGDKAAASATNTMTFADKTVCKFSIEVVGYDHVTGDMRVDTYSGIFNRQTGAATAVILGLVTTAFFSSGGGAAWVTTVTANVARGGLDVTVTGAAATNIRWGYTATCREITL